MKTKLAISGICLALAIAHLLCPDLKIDMATIALLVVGVVPWLAPIIRSVELPGGFKIELQDVKAAADKVSTANAPVVSNRGSEGQDGNFEFLRQVADGDPNLALVGLRIELERKLSTLARQVGLQTSRRSAGALLRDLTAHGRIDRQSASGLSDLIALGNQAAHGAQVSSDAAAWALDQSPLILEWLDALISKGLSPTTQES